MPELKKGQVKKLFLIILSLLPAVISAQSTGSLTVFSDNGDKFYVFLDGIKQNDVPRSKMRIVDLPDLYYSAKIIFEDAALWPVSKNNLYVSDGDDIMQDASYRLRRDKTGRPKLNFYSMAPVQQNFVATAGMHVFHFGQPALGETMATEIKQVRDNASVLMTGSLTVFSQNDDPFFLFLDGVKQNEDARTNICIRQIPGLYYNARIVFKDSRLAPIIKNNLFISDGDDNLMDAAYRIRRDKTGKPKLNFYSMKTVQPEFKAAPGMFVYDFGNSAPANKFATNNPANTLTKTAIPVFGTISNIEVTDPPSLKKAAEKNNTVTKNPRASEKIKTASGVVNRQDIPVTTVAKKIPSESTSAVPENKKCNGWPMGKGDLAAAKKIIEGVVKDDEKLSAAQEIIASNCLLVSQVTEFCNMFRSEKFKLAFAKYAYKFTIDRKNYREVTKVLALESSKKELNKFITGG